MYFLQAHFKDGEEWLSVNRETNALNSWRWAADKGSKEGLWRLGLVYSKIGVSYFGPERARRLALPDYPRAIKYFAMSSALGYSDAQFHLACMYVNGEGVTQNHAEATRLLLNAADSEHMNAAHMLAMWYCHGGNGVKQDHSAAARIFQTLVDVDFYDLERRGVLNKIQPMGYWPKDARFKKDASYQLGLLYLRGDGVVQNYAEAASHFRNGPKHWEPYMYKRNCQESDYELGLLYFDGLGVEQDYKMAIKLLEFDHYVFYKSSRHMLFKLSMYLKLGELYLKLNLNAKAVHLFRSVMSFSARFGSDFAAASILAAKFLTDINIKGEGTGQDHVEAARLFKFVAAKLGTKSAQRSCATALPPISYPFCGGCGGVDVCNFGPCRNVCSLCQVEDARSDAHTCYDCFKVTRHLF